MIERQYRCIPSVLMLWTFGLLNAASAAVNDDIDYMSMVKCEYFRQPLNHFDPGNDIWYNQRYCSSVKKEEDDKGNNRSSGSGENKGPILFYTGNESPLEEYINHSGFMWDFVLSTDTSTHRHAEHENDEYEYEYEYELIFAEHRFEGKSMPTEGGLRFASIHQAMADYAALISYIDPTHTRPVICFGGSYGGMLSAYMRFRYPSLVAGAISASGPIWGFPLTNPRQWYDGAARVISRSIRNFDYIHEDWHCADNLQAAWPLIHYYGQSTLGRHILSSAFQTCQPIQDVSRFLSEIQSIFFYLAEGNYPFASSYIPSALNMGNFKLPPYPLQHACQYLKSSYGITQTKTAVTTDPSDENKYHDDRHNKVQYTLHYPQSNLKLKVNWDQVTPILPTNNYSLQNDTLAFDLFKGLKQALSVWYNVSQSLTCLNIPTSNEESTLHSVINKNYKRRLNSNFINQQQTNTNIYQQDLEKENHNPGLLRQPQHISNSFENQVINASKQQMCIDKVKKESVWASLICNDNIHLVTGDHQGLGNDIFWPPTLPKNYTEQTILQKRREDYKNLCADPHGIYGYSSSPESYYEPFSKTMDTTFGGIRIQSFSNVVFSNGNLDPWSAAGVIVNTYNDTIFSVPGLSVENITSSILSLQIHYGAHHLDLMAPNTKQDPIGVQEARIIEKHQIKKWIHQWYQKK